jgi:hypothetical protein
MNEELENWEREVAAFGGRINSPHASADDELSRTVLGSIKEIPTAGAVAISAAPITLAEMNVSKPLAVDVSFSYPNLVQGSGLGQPLNVGDGFVQVTWGVKGAAQQVARVDGAAGWRYPFVASHLLVQYFPVDTSSTGGRVIPTGQARNLQLAANIAPASGAPCLPLTKTVFFADILPAASSQQQIPIWAKQVRTVHTTNVASGYTLGFFDSGFAQVCLYSANGVAGQYPNFALQQDWFEVPQGAVIANYGSAVGAPIGLLQPKLIFRLAL